MAKEKTYRTTEKGLKKLLKELEERETKIREKITQALNEARNQGDLRENDGYSLALDEQQANETRIAELKDKIDSAEVIKECKTRKEEGNRKIDLGCTVTLKNGKEVTYELVGEEDANPLEGKISHISPIGSALIGKKLGNKVKISTPTGKVEYEIVKIF